MPRLQVGQISQSQAALTGEPVLSQNVWIFSRSGYRSQTYALGHRCESCIDRLFTLGPAPCPICAKILRKLAFTPQTFEDLGVEKEVAIRRRMAKEYGIVV